MGNCLGLAPPTPIPTVSWSLAWCVVAWRPGTNAGSIYGYGHYC